MSEDYVNPATYMLIDRVTGEEVDVDLFIKKASKDYWERAYAKVLAEYIEVGGTSSCRVLAYIIRIKTAENIVNATVREVAVSAKVSQAVASKVIKALHEKALLKKIRNGCYLLSPHLLRHGSKTRGAMLIRLWDDS